MRESPWQFDTRARDGELRSAEGVDRLWTGHDYEVANKQTGRAAIDVRRAIVKVGQNRARIMAELKTQER